MVEAASKHRKLLIIKYFYINPRVAEPPTLNSPRVIDLTTPQYIKVRFINHSLTFPTSNFSLFINLKITPPINSAHHF
ncbi:hypothetical protein BLAT2472_80064 [Burkholderia latens]